MFEIGYFNDLAEGVESSRRRLHFESRFRLERS